MSYVSINFERERLAERLSANGFQQDEPAFFCWLGVTMYLTEEATALESAAALGIGSTDAPGRRRR